MCLIGAKNVFMFYTRCPVTVHIQDLYIFQYECCFSLIICDQGRLILLLYEKIRSLPCGYDSVLPNLKQWKSSVAPCTRLHDVLVLHRPLLTLIWMSAFICLWAWATFLSAVVRLSMSFNQNKWCSIKRCVCVLYVELITGISAAAMATFV